MYVKTPTILQMDAIESGAVCLSIILAYYKRFVSVDTLRTDCGISRDGCKPEDIMHAANRYGLETTLNIKKINEFTAVTFPAIAFWQSQYFVVITGIKDNIIYLNDPACGHRIISKHAFSKEYSNLLLEFKLTPIFQKGGMPPRVLKPLTHQLSKYIAPLSFVFFTGLGLTLLSLAPPIFSKIFVDNYLIEHTTPILNILIIGIILTAILRFFISLLENYYLVLFENKLTILSSEKLLWHIMRLPLEFFSQRYSGDITHRIELVRETSKFIASIFTRSILHAILVIIYFTVLIYFDFSIALIVLTAASINMAIFYLISKQKKENSLLLNVNISKYYSEAYNIFKIIETIKASGREQEVFSKIVGAQTRISNTLHKMTENTQLISILPMAINSLAYILILLIGAQKIMDGSMTIGSLVAIQSIALSLMLPLKNILDIVDQVVEMTGALARIDDILDRKIDSRLDLSHFSQSSFLLPESKAKLSGYIEISDLCFGYNPIAFPLIKNMNIVIYPGEHVAIVGASGSGKTTLLKLISNLHLAWSGSILIDGNNINTINRLILANSIAVVQQEGILFNDSLKNNLTLWENSVSYETIVKGAKDAFIHEEISLRKNGYNTMVSENGINFSGGEKQRIEIARALISYPSILILDEATSELDIKVESQIFDNIRMLGCTTIFIAHRLNAIRNADKIIVLEEGKITQMGTHNTLISVPGQYSNLMSMG